MAECDGVEPLAALLEEAHAGCVMFAAQCVSAISIDGVCMCVAVVICSSVSTGASVHVYNCYTLLYVYEWLRLHMCV